MGPHIDAVLKELEQDLFDPRVRRNEPRLAELLAEEFREFGCSGGSYTRSEMIAMLAVEQGGEIALEDFRAERLSDECALVTYRTRRQVDSLMRSEALRSSIWVWRAERWQMVFHQGTRVDRR